MSLLTGTAEDNLLALINQVNTFPVPLASGDLYYGKIKQLTDGSGKIQLPTVTMYDAQYDGYVTFQYQRINLTKAFGGLRPRLSSLGQPTLYRLLPTLNRFLGLKFTERDVVDVNISWLGGNEQANIQIIAQPNSLGFEGSFVIQFTRVRPFLSVVTNNTPL